VYAKARIRPLASAMHLLLQLRLISGRLHEILKGQLRLRGEIREEPIVSKEDKVRNVNNEMTESKHL
jgi:hypothetical protein